MHAARFDISPPMRDIIRNLPDTPNVPETESGLIPNIFIKSESRVNTWVVPDYSNVQTAPTGTPAPALGASFDGIGNPAACGGCIPPDTNGDVSDQHYIQWVNSRWAIYNKLTGAVVQAPTVGSSFFAGFGGKCQTTNSGDPIALWDAQAKRWVMSQFVTTSPFAQCVAVSVTSDPLGAYYRYEFNWPNFGDYPHMGIWTEENHRQDAYLLTTHEFSAASAFLGASLIAMQRDKMLQGDPTAAMVRFPGFDAYGVQAIHLIGPKEAPGGSCPTFIHFDFSASNYRFWDMCLDWTTPANSTVSAPNTVASDPFFPFFDQVPTPAGAANWLDSFGSNTMYRATARAFDKDAPTRVSLVLNHVVQGNGLQAGIKWVQFNLKPAVEPVGVTDRIFGDGFDGAPLPVVVPITVMTKQRVDSGIYAPDSDYRWMGGVAIDASGNIGLGFSKSSAVLNPQVQYTARRAIDPPGTMRDEQTCSAGIANGAQTDSAQRWGDYSSMSVDPVDQCTFYFTTEYYATSSTRNFSTRICSFKFPDCGTPDFQLVSDSPTRVQLCGATASDPTWNLRAGVLNGFTGPVTLSGVGVPATTTAMFATNPINAPGTSVLTLSGGAALTDGEYSFSANGISGALNRSVGLELGVSSVASGAPGLVAPANNATSVSVLPTLSWNSSAGALTYKVEIATDVGFTNIVATATVSATTYKVSSILNESTQYFWRVTPQNYCGNGAPSAVFAFTTGLIGQCPGGTVRTTVYSSDFQTIPAAGWTIDGSGGTAGWTQQAAPAGTGMSTTVFGIPNNATTGDRGLISPVVVVPAAQAVFLTFDTYHSFETDGPTGCWDNATIQVKSGAGPFTYLENSSLFTDPYDGVVSAGEANAGALGWCHKPSPVPTGGKQSIVDLNSYAGQSINIRFRAVSDSNSIGTAPTGMFIDNLKVDVCQ
ncbi:MAG: fibronectin type III domain-containing protein [Xanthomonadales bacterium]|nr:fibronectin type III domain-containing protein [Xanthomonadales bacterium]